MGNSAVIVPRGAGHQPALRIRQMNIPFHRHRKIRGKRFRIIPEHIRQTFPQVNRSRPVLTPQRTPYCDRSMRMVLKKCSFLPQGLQE